MGNRLTLGARKGGLQTTPDTTNDPRTVIAPDGTLYGEASNSTLLQTSKTTLTSAQVLALFTTPITVIAAQGANTVVEVVSVFMQYDYGSVAYTIGSATNLTLKYTNASGAAATATQSVTGFLDQTADETRIVPVVTSGYEPVTNAPVVISLAGANVTAGNGTLGVTVAYRVHTLS